jgi:aminoglycoside phosphotransferase (APT) family kinase protein
MRKTCLLRATAELMKFFDSNTPIQQFLQPAIWHTDLHLGNIFVSESGPPKILSFIDWQSVSISPLFLQARWPVFSSRQMTIRKVLFKPDSPITMASSVPRRRSWPPSLLTKSTKRKGTKSVVGLATSPDTER